VIDIQHDDGNLVALSARTINLPFQAFFHVAAVIEPGQRITNRQIT
jgi:hypothetical protein